MSKYKDKDNLYNAYILNVAIFCFEIVAFIWMISGVTVFSNSNILTSTNIEIFKYFTIDSNLLMGITAIILAIQERKIIKGKRKKISNTFGILKLLSTVGVALTMIVTIFFLVPTFYDTFGLFGCFRESNFLFHLVNPILSIIVFIKYEKIFKINIGKLFYCILPELVYSTYYIAVTLLNTTDGVIAEGYDWYGFFMFGKYSTIIILPIVFLLTYMIGLILWKINKR